MDKLKVGVLGAGEVGMEFVRAMDKHPHFEIVELYGNRSAGKKLEDVVVLSDGDFDQIRTLRIKPTEPMGSISKNLDLICSALSSDSAKTIEGECAVHTPVISTASAYRYEGDVPIIITEINPDHYKILGLQSRRGWDGWIAPGPNCTTVGLVMSLYPIHKAIGVKNVSMVSLQAISGGGKELVDEWKRQKTNGAPAYLQNAPFTENPPLILHGNVICRIKDEEEKVRRETKKILGYYKNDRIANAEFGVDPKCFRVEVLDGHTESVCVETLVPCTVEDVVQAYRQFNQYARSNFGSLPSSPENFVTLMKRAPQPAIDVNLDKGMTASVGKIEPLDGRNGVSYVVLTHNLQRGAAKGSVHFAEHLYEIGFLKRK